MSTVETKTETTVAAAPKKAVKKSVKKSVKKVAKKVASKTSSKKVDKSATLKKEVKKGGLRKPQVRILKCLSKANHPLNRAEISEKGSVDLAMLNSYIGSNDEAIRAKNDKIVMPSLLTLKLVQFGPSDDGPSAYVITAAGRKALAALND